MLAIKIGTGAGGATLNCTTNPLATNASGVAGFSGCGITLTANGYKLTASSGALSVDSNSFDISGTGAVAHLSFTHSPTGGTGGTAFGTQPVVALTDSGGNPTSGSVTLSITDGTGSPDATLHCTSNTVSSSSNSSTFAGCNIDLIGEGYTLTATSGSVTATSDAFDITVGSPAKLAFSAQPGGGTGGLPWSDQPVVQVRDAGGNQTTSTADVTLSITSGTGSGTLACSANTIPAVHGSAQFGNCAIDRTGTSLPTHNLHTGQEDRFQAISQNRYS